MRTFTKSIIDLHAVTNVWSTSGRVRYVVCNIMGQANDEFRSRWNNYKDNNRKSLRGEDHKQARFFAHFQTAGHNDFISDTGIRFIDKANPWGTLLDVRIFG